MVVWGARGVGHVDSDIELGDSLGQAIRDSPFLHNENATLGVWEVRYLHLGRCPTSASRSGEEIS